MPDLTTVADVKSASGIGAGTSNSDAVLARLVTAVSSFIVEDTDRSFGAVLTVNEIRNGNGQSELFLAEAPIVSITSLTVNTTPIAAQAADGKPGYFIVTPSVLALYGYTFSRGKRNVRITYTAGYAAVPAEVAQACIEIVIAAYRRCTRGPEITSENVPASGANFSFSQKDVSPWAATVLDKYRKVTPL